MISDKVFEGYGQTEVTAAVCMTLPHEYESGQLMQLLIVSNNNNNLHVLIFQAITDAI